jgi:HK97 family phage prohead protease
MQGKGLKFWFSAWWYYATNKVAIRHKHRFAVCFALQTAPIFTSSNKHNGKQMAFKKTFILSDESINSYGFWVRTAGMKLERFKANAPLFYDHRTYEMPIGHVENIRVENGKLLGDVIIDGADQREKDFIRKVENGDLKGVSLGFDVIQWSEDPLFIKEGQTAPCLWESEPYEASLTPMPANGNALVLRKDGSVINLSSEAVVTNIIPTLKNLDMEKKLLAVKLGLSESASETEISERLTKLMHDAANAEAMRKHIGELAAAELDTPEKQALFTELSKNSFENAMSFLKLNKKVVAPVADAEAEDAPPAAAPGKAIVKDLKVSDLIEKGKANLSKTAANGDAKDCYDYLQKHNPAELSRIRTEDPEKYLELAKAYGTGKRYVA